MNKPSNKRLVWFAVIVFLMVGAGVGLAAVPQSTVQTNAGGITTYVGHYGNFTESVESSEYFLSSVNKTDIFAFPQQPASYIVWVDNSTGTPNYYAKNGTTGNIDYSGAVAQTVINNALSAVPSGALISMKAGTYITTGSINLRNNTQIIGAGHNQTRILSLFNGDTLIATSPNALMPTNIIIRDIYIEGNKTAFAAGSAIVLDNQQTCILNNILIRNMGANGIVLDGGSNIYLSDVWVQWVVDDCYFVNAEHVNMYNCISDGGTRSLRIDATGHYAQIIACHFEGSSGDGISSIGPRGIISETKIIFSGSKGINLFAAATHTQINGGLIFNTTGVGIDTAAPDTTINGVSITNENTFGIDVDSTADRTNIIGCDIITDGQFEDNIIVRADDVVITGNMGVNEDALGPSIEFAGAPTGLNIQSNNFNRIMVGVPGANSIIRGNQGYVTENTGNATLAAITSNIVVNHGCDYTPTLGDIQVTPSRNLGNCTYYWYDTITATQFTIHVGAAGATKNIDQTVYFLWSVNRH